MLHIAISVLEMASRSGATSREMSVYVGIRAQARALEVDG
jgi:hypothetical protein